MDAPERIERKRAYNREYRAQNLDRLRAYNREWMRASRQRRPCATPGCATMIPSDRGLCHFCRRTVLGLA